MAPPGSAFCNACGLDLRAVAPDVTDEAPARPPSDVGRRAFAVAAVGIAAVVGLYALTVWSADEPDTPVPAAADAVGPAAAIPDGAPPLPDSLQAAADRFAAQGTASGWYESGRYYLTAAFDSRQTDPTASVQWTRRAIEDFEQSLALDEDPNVRFALAEAAAFDPTDPMRPIQELRSILGASPDYVPALLMLGDMRRQIGRVDSARVSFERVVALTPPGDPLRQRAEEALRALDGG